MRKVMLLTVPLLVPLFIGVLVLAFEARRPVDWRVELGRYMHYQNTHSSKTVSIQAAVEARHPWQFSQDLSGASLGDTMFRTDNNYNGRRGGYIALPIPPERVWCVLLAQKAGHTGQSPNYEVIFVSYHNDNVWWQDWVVHTGSSEWRSPEFAEQLALLGCDLDLP